MPKRKSQVITSIFRCNICRKPFSSREQFTTHCEESHNITINNPDQERSSEQDPEQVEPKPKSSRLKSSEEGRESHAKGGDLSTGTQLSPGASGENALQDDTEPVSKKMGKRQRKKKTSCCASSSCVPKSESACSVSKTSETQANEVVTETDSEVPSTLQQPKNSKTGFTCPVPDCQMFFDLQSRYRFTNHLEIHEGKKGFVCMYCDFGYNDEIKLMEHVTLKHTKEANFECPECGRSYKAKRYLDSHVQTCHH